MNQGFCVRDCLAQGTQILHKASSNTNMQYESFITRARLEAEILLAFVLKKSRVWLHTYNETKVRRREYELFLGLVCRRAKGYPIEYLTHKASFFESEFFVDSRVLIPRPESEILLYKVCEVLVSYGITPESKSSFFVADFLDSSVQGSLESGEKDFAHRDSAFSFEMIEVGVGSGALSISLARLFPKAHIIATDISKDALEVAAYNAKALGVAHQIQLVHTSLLDTLNASNALLVFSNPPYIANSYTLPKNVAFEPRIALFGGESGSEILSELIAQCAAKNIAHLVCEMGYDQRQCMQNTLESYGYRALFYQDLAGLDRGFVAHLCHKIK